MNTNIFFKFLAGWVLLTLLLTGCSNGGGGSPTDDNAMQTFSSRTQLAEYLKKGMQQTSAKSIYSYAETADAASPAGASNDQTVSRTNLQEIGVDEADIIKSDGQYLYIIQGSNQEIRIMELNSNPAEAVQAGKITLDSNQNRVEGLYLLSQENLLVTIAGRADNIWGIWHQPWQWQNGTTEVGIYNVDNPANTTLNTFISIDGQLISSRRIQNTLYLVTRYTPSIEGYESYPAGNNDQTKNETLLAEANLEELLPDIEVNHQNLGDLIQPSSCYLPPYDPESDIEPTLITITAINLSPPFKQVSRSIAGPTQTIYMSSSSLYLATTRYNSASTDTELHKFILTESGPSYRGSGTVTGHLGWEEDKKPFRMGEYKGVLRIATSLGESWTQDATMRLSLFRENNDALVEISHLENIGKKGERLYAARFIQERAYLVTFRVTDPLYVFDLSDPENPRQAGELEIDGYSDYLHPINANLLLGIGKDAVADQSSSDFGGAWYQGVKLSLFDVSDPANPTELDAVVIGKRGTESDALYDHHALAYLPPTDTAPARLALPIHLHESIPDQDSYKDFDPNKPNAYYEWTHTGLYLFDITSDTVKSQGQMIVEESTTNQPYYYWNGNTDRAVLLRNSIHYIHGGQVWSAPWAQPDQMSNPQ